MKDKTIDEMNGLREFIDEKMEEWEVPGLAIGIIKKGQVIFSEGFGKKDIEKELRVTPNTIFAIGSASKAFTTMSLGILVDEGELNWDRPVRDYMNEFKMYDSSVSEKITVRDMACHRTGLPRHDLMWYNSSFSRKEIVERIQYLEHSKEFRTAWQYQNHMYIALGYLIEKISDMTWEEFVQLMIFNELDMTNSNFSVIQSQNSSDFSYPYDVKGGKIIKMPFRNIDVAGPAGSINSNLCDMLKWLKLHMNNGKFNSEQLISEHNLSQMHAPIVLAPLRPWNFNELQLSSYGLGWFIEGYRGYRMIHHGGNIDGFSALVTFIPEEQIGMVILTNKNSSLLPTVVSLNIYDRLLGIKQINWSRRLKDYINKKNKNVEKQKETISSNKKNKTNISHELKDYTGEYKHLGYGNFSVILDNKKLKGIYNSLEIYLTHYHYDIFEGYIECLDITILISFFTNKDGNINSLSIPLEASLNIKEIEFRKI